MIIKIDCPEYILDKHLDLKKVGQCIDRALVDHFDGKKVVLRTLSSHEHKMSFAELIQKIEQLGYDRYDPERIGDRYSTIDGKHIDFFGRPCVVSSNKTLSLPLLEGFHIYGARFHGRPFAQRNIWLVYDRLALKSVMHMDENGGRVKRDGYVFKNPENKPKALLGILVIE